MPTELFNNVPTTTVTTGGTTAPASGSTENWTVASSALFPAASNTPTASPTSFHVADPASNSEIVAVTNVSGAVWSVIRGSENTTPVTHVAGFTVYQVVTAGWLGGISQVGSTVAQRTIAS